MAAPATSDRDAAITVHPKLWLRKPPDGSSIDDVREVPLIHVPKVAMTPPMAPVLLSLDAELQENLIADSEGLRIPKLANVVPPVGDAGALEEAAKMLVAAENPVIICDRLARSPAGMGRLVELAETLQCAVVDNAGRMNFPSRHPLNQSFRRSVISQADPALNSLRSINRLSIKRNLHTSFAAASKFTKTTAFISGPLAARPRRT